jgi:hypothetical protein
MSTDTNTGPPREGERYADEIEFEGHMNTPWTIDGARWEIHPDAEIGDTYANLVIPHVSRLARFDGDETVVALADGCTLRSGAPDLDHLVSGQYVRLCDPDGTEVVYYDEAEWAEDPALVMGALLNAAAGVRLA